MSEIQKVVFSNQLTCSRTYGPHSVKNANPAVGIVSAWTKDSTSMSYYSRELCHSILTSRYSTSYYHYFSDEETYAQRTLRNVSMACGIKDQIPHPSELDLSSEALGPTAPAVFWVSPESKCPVAPFSQQWRSKTASSGNPTGTNQEQAKTHCLSIRGNLAFTSSSIRSAAPWTVPCPLQHSQHRRQPPPAGPPPPPRRRL